MAPVRLGFSDPQAKGSGEFEPRDAGTYPCTIFDIEVLESKKGNEYFKGNVK